MQDVKERAHWKNYERAYEEMLERDEHAARAVVRHPGRPQVVHAGRRREHPGRDAAETAAEGAGAGRGRRRELAQAKRLLEGGALG